MKRFAGLVLPLLLVFSSQATGLSDADSPTDGACMTCHKEKTPGLYKQWYESEHGTFGVTCIDCHQASEQDADAFTHEGMLIATLVTPNDCGNCHDEEAAGMASSNHARAGEILVSADAYLAQVTGGEPIAIVGCESCHGAKVEIDTASIDKLSRKSWPNSGIGRLNPDGSKGSCNACHTRHSFSRAQARRPESCSKCHLGPDHPQKEVYEESKHGNAYYTHLDKMNIGADRWVVGQDYFEAPTCATCHMSATMNQPVSHDVGRRLSWTLRPPVSVHKDDWKTRRADMKQVCFSCHSPAFVDGYYYQFDAVVALYNEKFAEPAGRIMEIIKEKSLLQNPAQFSNKIEWTYWELWHHEGRRVRHGTAMMAPDYAWWQGMYEMAKHFYFKLLPEAREFDDPELNAYLDNLENNDPMHQWLKTPTAELQSNIQSGRLQEIYQKMFDQE